VFPSLSIWHHYVEFDIHTIATLEKLLGVGSFGGFISPLVHCQATFPTSLGGFDIFFVIWITTPTCLGCWALIALALFICFQQDDHHIFWWITYINKNLPCFQ
jgi:hypothetical protein